jgi:hypothetical protein
MFTDKTFGGLLISAFLIMVGERQPRYVPPEEDFWKVYEKAEGQDKVMLLEKGSMKRGQSLKL